MRKKLLVGILFFAMILSGVSLFFSLQSTPISNLMLANIEALANDEELSGGESEFSSPTGFPYTIVCNVAISDKRRCKATVITCQGGGTGCNPRPCPVHG